MPKSSEVRPEVVANCMGIDVPASPFLHEKRIERINAARYEGQEIEGALHVVREGDSILELGAGIGIVGAVVSKIRKPKIVQSYEANPSLIPHINALYQANGLTKTNRVFNEVLVSAPDSPATMPFYVHNSFLGSSLFGSNETAKETVDVPTAGYDDVRRDLKPDVILMDIEGGELAFLEHANLDGVRAIVAEFHPKAYEVAGMRRCKSILRDAGFEPLADFSTRTVWVATREL